MRLFAATLFAATLLACIPSEPWRRGFFEFYTLSWFHVYVSGLVAVFALLLSQFPATRRSIAAFVTLAILAVVPLAGALHLAGSFVSGNLNMIVNITEAKSPYELLIEGGEPDPTMYMSWLLVLLFPMFAVNAWWAWRQRDPVLQFVAVMSLFGLALFQFQYRFGVYGLVPMLLTPLLVAQRIGAALTRRKWLAPAAAAAMFVVAFLPTRDAWGTTFALGSHLAYSNIVTRP
jgi:hypothetical protein